MKDRKETKDMRDPVKLFREAERFIRKRGFGPEIDWCDKRPGFETVGAQQFLASYAWVVLNSGMRNRVIEQKWNEILEAFWQFDVDRIANNDEEALTNGWAVFRNRKKMQAIVDVACLIYDKGYDNIKAEVQKRPLEALSALPYIGDVTKFHLARNLGFEYVKPDRHLVRLASFFDLDVFQLCEEIHRQTGRRLGAIDVILWRYCEQKAFLGSQVILDDYIVPPEARI